MITDFPCWVDVDIARFQKYKKIRKMKIYKKKEKKKRKGKVEGLVWKPRKTFPINTKLQWTQKRGGEIDTGEDTERRRKTEGKKEKNLNLQKTIAAATLLNHKKAAPSFGFEKANRREPLSLWNKKQGA